MISILDPARKTAQRTFHILVTEVLGDRALDLLRAAPDVDVEAYDLLEMAKFHERLAEADAVIVRSAHGVRKPEFAVGTRLRVAARAGTGIDNIDLEEATRRGILVVNTPGANAVSAAEHTWGLLLALMRRVRTADHHVRSGRWDRAAFLGEEARGRTLGIIGIGRVGREVARFGRAFGMSVHAYDPYVPQEVFDALGVTRHETLEGLLPHAQVLTIHTPKTGPRLARSEFERLPAGAYVLNVARGGLMDEEALADLLETGHLGGVALDVFEHEPPDPALRLLHRDDVLVTCHLGGSTLEAQERIGERIALAVLEALRGQVPDDVANLPPPAPGTSAAKTVAAGSIAGRLLTATAPRVGARLVVETSRFFPSESLPLVARAALAGVLTEAGEDGVNPVNAVVRGRDRGMELATLHDGDGTYDGGGTERDALLRVFFSADAVEPQPPGSLGTTGARSTVAGTLPDGVRLSLVTSEGGHSHQLRLRQVFGATLNLDLTGRALLVTRHVDRPGVVGAIGTLLGQSGINIGALELGRDLPGGAAVMALTMDSVPSESVVEACREMPGMEKVVTLSLTDGQD